MRKFRHIAGSHSAANAANYEFAKHLLGSTSATAMMVVSVLAGPQAFAAEAPQSAQAAPIEEVVVTGSRIVRDGYSAPTPVTVVGVEEINREAPMNIADYVNMMPEFMNSTTSHNTQTSVSNGNGGVSNLNLRALGTNRTLVLLDGNRIAPSAIGGAVDTNSFPTALISRVDVVTGGASAVYGSDALSGVVNFVLDKTYTGVKGQVVVGETGYGDDQSYLVNMTAGANFAGGRGHVLLAGEMTRNDGILNNGTTKKSNRQWVNDDYFYLVNPAYTSTNGKPYYLTGPYYGSSNYTLGGIINSGPLLGTAFGPGGTPYKLNYGSINNGTGMFGGDYQQTDLIGGANFYGPAQSLDSQLKRYNLFTRVSYDVVDNVQAFVQFMYAKTNTFAYGGPGQVSNVIIQSGNPFIPASVQSQMTAMKLTSFNMASILGDLGMAGPNNSRQMNEYIAGLSGNFDVLDSNWKWDTTAERSVSRLTVHAFNDLIKPNLILAEDAVRDSSGNIVCRSTLTSPSNGCVPFNIMGTGVNSPAAIKYVESQAYLAQKIQQDDVTATMHGQPFSTWAGPVAVAFGVEHRKEGITAISDPLSQQNAFFIGNFHPTIGHYYVTEGFVETDVPLATDQAWAKSLNLNAAVRETGYSTSGNVTTWKVGATYQPVDDVRFRATRSRDIRAPNLGELFQAGQSGTGLVNDPFKGNASVQFNTLTVGNQSLTPEVADTTGGGVIYTPGWLPGFNASFDYYNINLKQVIASSGSQAIMDQCYAGNQIFCSLISRNAAGNLAYIYLSPANTQAARENGFDFESSYRKRMSEIVDSWDGSLTLRALVTHVFNLSTLTTTGQYLNGAGVNDGGISVPSSPKWIYNLSVAYDNDQYGGSLSAHGFGAGVHNTAWVQCTSGCPAQTATSASIDNNHLPGVTYLDLNLTYHLNFEPVKSDLFFTVQNLTNWEPNFVIISTPGTYNLLGRMFRAGVRFAM